MSDAPLLLIVRQRPAPHPELEELLDALREAFQLDIYTTRQRLLGAGLVQLVQGERSRLEGLMALLRRHGYACWVVPPSRPTFAPPRLRSLAIDGKSVEFFCEGDQVARLVRGGTAVGVLADLSGELAGKQVKRMLARNAYLGREQATVFTPEEIRQAILKEQPVFDCYLLDESGGLSAAFRALPGRFSPEGLGGRASLGAARNLEALVDLVGEYAGNFSLDTGFGLSQLHGCQPQPSRENPLALQGNLEALTRYGWLVSSLDARSGEVLAPGEVSPGTALATGITAAAGMAGVIPAAEMPGEVGAAIDEAVSQRPAASVAPSAAALPPPPERPEQKFSLRRALPLLTATAGGVVLAMAKGSGVLGPVFDPVVRSGLLPGAVAAALAWWGFAFLKLKRHIEVTPTSRIRSLAMGLVEVRGRAIRRYALVAPMTQGACVWYRLRKYRRDNRNNWTLTSESDSNHVPFALDDGSGRVLVDPAGARIRAGTEETSYPGEGTLLGALVDGGPDEKWVEELIYEGTTLYVLGYARPARGVRASLSERTAAVLRRLKLDPRSLRRYDSNGDGRVDADEWQAAREDAGRLAAAEELNESRSPGTNRALLGKPPRGLPFLIAEGQAGNELASRYGSTGAMLLVLAVVAFGLALKLSLEFFGLI